MDTGVEIIRIHEDSTTREVTGGIIEEEVVGITNTRVEEEEEEEAMTREKTASTTDGMRITGEGGMKDIGAEMTDEIVVAVGLQLSEKTFQKVNSRDRRGKAPLFLLQQPPQMPPPPPRDRKSREREVTYLGLNELLKESEEEKEEEEERQAQGAEEESELRDRIGPLL